MDSLTGTDETSTADGDATEEWGPFGRPLFADPEARALSRVGVIDVGSNSVRMVVFDGAARSPAYFFNEKVMCALGQGVSDTGRLNPEGRARALAAITRFAALADGLDIHPLNAVATAAVRDAEDGAEFCAEVKKKTGVTVHVIPGDEEARLSAQGVLLGWPGSYGLVCDIGGSSMELALLDKGEVGRRTTSALGPLKLRDLKGGKKALKAHIQKTVKGLLEEMGEAQGKRLFLVGGSWRAIAKIDMVRREYPLTVLHEYRMTKQAITRTRDMIAEADLNELRGRAGVSEARMALVPLASMVLTEVVRAFKPKDITVSSYGIREGMLYEQMPPALRERDPLIEACRFAEAKDARVPGFGKVLYDFIKPLFPYADWQKKRIIKAACLLHDVSWRAHPDYRHEVTFDNATRANLGGLKHAERIFMGRALMYRYSSKAPSGRFVPLEAVLTEKERLEAEVLGRAMRFGAMLWLHPGEMPGEMRYHPKKHDLELRLSPAAAPLFGEVAEARFRALAVALGAEPKIRQV